MEAEKVKKFRSVYRKKRRFTGNQFVTGKCATNLRKEGSTTPESSATTDRPRPTSNRPVPVLTNATTPTQEVINNPDEAQSASARKILTAEKNLERVRKSHECKPTGFRFFDMEISSQILSVLACPECYNIGVLLKEISQKRFGNASFFKLECCNCEWKHVFYSSKKAGRAFEVNRRIVYAFRTIGKGRSSAAKFCGLMNMPPPLHSKAYRAQESVLDGAVQKVACETMSEAASEICATSDGDEYVETEVSADGTWQKRGYSSLHGVATIMSMDTGKVLDTEILSQFCKACSLHEKDDKSTAAYNVWKTEHLNTCTANSFESCFGRTKLPALAPNCL